MPKALTPEQDAKVLLNAIIAINKGDLDEDR
jgi:hypothetical protein